MTTKCFIGWSQEGGNQPGDCCCNCKWQRPISGHPGNATPAFKGRITGVIAWGCTVPDLESINLSERQHGICEVHERKV